MKKKKDKKSKKKGDKDPMVLKVGEDMDVLGERERGVKGGKHGESDRVLHEGVDSGPKQRVTSGE